MGQFIWSRSDDRRNKAITRKFVINRLVMNLFSPMSEGGKKEKRKKEKISEINFMEIHTVARGDG